MLAFIHEPSDTPWFASYWAFSVHSPWNRERDVEPGKVQKYIDRIQPAPGGEEEHAQRQPVMGAMIETLDDNVGRVMNQLEASGQMENTIVVFFSDNGGVHWAAPKKDGWSDRPVTSNFPLRGGKATIYEGGTRVPLAILWPGHTEPGSETDALVSSVDLAPTLAAMAGLELPDKPQPAGLDGHGGGHSDGTLDGVDFSAVLTGAGFERKPLFVHFPHGWRHRPGYQPSSSVIDGGWKLIRFYADLPEGAPADAEPADRHELYHLDEDLGERIDLSGPNPSKLAKLTALLDAWLADTGAVIPTANPGYAGPVTQVFEPVVIDGWRVHKDAQGSARGGRLFLDGFGIDPYLFTAETPAVSGELTLRIRMKASAGDGGQVFWKTTTNDDYRQQRVEFEPPVGKKIEVVEVSFQAESDLTTLRLDPTNAVADVEIDWIELRRRDGEVLQRWEFE